MQRESENIRKRYLGQNQIFVLDMASQLGQFAGEKISPKYDYAGQIVLATDKLKKGCSQVSLRCSGVRLGCSGVRVGCSGVPLGCSQVSLKVQNYEDRNKKIIR